MMSAVDLHDKVVLSWRRASAKKRLFRAARMAVPRLPPSAPLCRNTSRRDAASAVHRDDEPTAPEAHKKPNSPTWI